MLRILHDPLGDGHDDLLLKIEGLPGRAWLLDSYFLGDFLNVVIAESDNDRAGTIAGALVAYLEERINSLGPTEEFIPFGLSDQSVEGFLASTSKRGLIRLKRAWTEKLAGFLINHVELKEQVLGIEWQYDQEWESSKEALLSGLAWSRELLKERTK